jgi:Icc-related predicted phosphoesterase
MSDVHLEFLRPIDSLGITISKEADLVVMAGDMTSSSHESIDRLREIFIENPDKTFVMVSGNHEFYGSQYSKEAFKKRYSDLSNCVILQAGDEFFFEGIRFIGDTLWTNIEEPRKWEVQKYFSDYRVIKGLRVEDTVLENSNTVEFLKDALDTKVKTVVVTHHTPSLQSIPARFKGDLLNDCFSNSLDRLIMEYQPEVWIHGHTHDSFDYKIGETRVICNPYGYEPIRLNPEYIQELVVEI